MPSHRQHLQQFQPKVRKNLFLQEKPALLQYATSLACLEFRFGVWIHGLHFTVSIGKGKIYILTDNTVMGYEHTPICIIISSIKNT